MKNEDEVLVGKTLRVYKYAIKQDKPIRSSRRPEGSQLQESNVSFVSSRETRGSRVVETDG